MKRCPTCGKWLIPHYTIHSEGRNFSLFFVPGPATLSSWYCRGHDVAPKPMREEPQRVPVPRVFYDAFAEEDQ